MFVIQFDIVANAEVYEPTQQATISSKDISEMTDDEFLEFIISKGVIIPNNMKNSKEFKESISSIIKASARSSETNYLIDNIVDDINNLVDNYQKVKVDAVQMRDNITANQLQNNLVWDNGVWSSTGGYWESNYMNYNCYSFAIGKTDDRYRYPGQHSGIWRYAMDSYSIFEMANFVKNDLIALGGYGNVAVYNTEPIIHQGQTLICIRKGNKDYHFMRYDADSGYWYHKPGGTAPLRYLHHPEDMIWVSEFSRLGVSYNVNDILANREEIYEYDSDIYYITYEESIFLTSRVNDEVTIAGIRQGCDISGYVEIPSTMCIDGTNYSVTSIGQNAFSGCNNLTSITIPATVTSIGAYAFKNCTSLQSVNFANSSQLSTIGDQAFNGCGNLTSISIPATVTSIGGLAFSDCVSLQSVTFASGSQLTGIGYNAFSDCSSLSSITIPATVTSIGSYVFNDCTSLQSVNFAENSQLTFISYNAFSDCIGLTSITIPASITSIGMQAFNTCTSLQSINFAENSQLSSIDYQAFINCSSLNSIQIPAGVTIIHPGVLSGCTSLQSVTFASGTQLSSIANNAFTGCTSLTNISLPATVTNIGYEAFYGCTNLEKVVIYNQTTVPTLGTNCFNGTHANLQIYVPNSLLNSYKTATNWSGYASKLEGYYIENGQPYILQTYTVSAANLLDCISLYTIDSNYDIESEGGVFLEYTAVIGYGMGHYFFAECLLDYDLGEVVDCSLKIEVYAGGTGCYLLDSDKYVITWCSVEDYILTVPFMEIYNYCEGEFYLFPEEDCEENIEFTAQDVSIEYVVKVNI